MPQSLRAPTLPGALGLQLASDDLGRAQGHQAGLEHRATEAALSSPG